MTQAFGESIAVSGPEAVNEIGARLGVASLKYSEYHDGEGLVRIASRIERTDPLLWLAQQQSSRKFYWRDRTGQLEIAALGEAIAFDSPAAAAAVLSHPLPAGTPEIRLFGGMRFDHFGRSEEWAKFPARQFIVPKIELIQTPEHAYFVCTAVNPGRREFDDLRSRLITVTWEMEKPEPLPGTHTILRTPGPAAWQQQIDAVLQAIRTGEISKAVLAQMSIVPFKRIVNPFHILARLRRFNPDTYLFAIQVGSNECFIGASPESLYRRDGQMLVTDSIAGTRRRGQVELEDDTLASQLFHSTKDRHEHEVVSRFIRETLLPLTETEPEITAPELFKLSRVQHLRSQLRARLCRDVTDTDLLSALHPTPAVGGYPKAPAVELIRQTEDFDRGWYAGVIGWCNAHAAEFAVGIRSALVSGNVVYAYAGAGIVAGSVAETEYDEIEYKLDILTSLLVSP